MTSIETVKAISVGNLHQVFDETEPTKRMAALLRLWHTDGVFVDTEGIFRSHQAISNIAGVLQKRFEGFKFRETGPVKIVNETPGEDFWIAKFPWAYGKPGQTEGVITGEDVVTVVDGKIKALYAFIEPPSH